jgi:ABC-type glycerol-3-phosphate transport system permease component
VSGATRLFARGAAALLALVFVFPYWWMFTSSLRSTEEAMTAPLRLWPERLDIGAYRQIAAIGGVTLERFALNSVGVTILSSLLAVAITAMAAYALNRRPRSPALRVLRYGFLVSIMYPAMLLVIPLYVVMHQFGLLGGHAGIVLFLALGPVQFFLFDQFFRSIPRELFDAALVDGADEWQVLALIVLPMARSVVATVALITFLLNWSQWFPVIVIANRPELYTLPAALLMLNTELGVSFQAIMALATVTTLPVVAVFFIMQRRIMDGFAAGAVKG